MNINCKYLYILLFAYLIYSSASIFMKFASYEEFLSYSFIFYYLIGVFILGVYAILWQIVLKRIPLSVAFVTKCITIVFSMIIARFYFQENISSNNLIGAGLVIVGIILLPIKK